jgi:uncharacterized protein YjbI with pentapeptide repeats
MVYNLPTFKEKVNMAGKDEIIVPSGSGGEFEALQLEVIDNLIDLLSRPTQGLTAGEYGESIAKRQEAVSKFLIRGGSETLRRFFDRIKELETTKPIKIDLSMLEISGKLLSGLYLPGANLEKLIFTDSDITGAELTGANLSEAVAVRAKMRSIRASGADFTSAVIPGADLSGAWLVGCTFINTVMPDVIVDKNTNFSGALFIDPFLGKTDLSVAHTTGAVFRGARR